MRKFNDVVKDYKRLLKEAEIDEARDELLDWIDIVLSENEQLRSIVKEQDDALSTQHDTIEQQERLLKELRWNMLSKTI